MDKKKLMELAERYQCKADTAFQNYQETGITRYDTARRNNEDMAEALSVLLDTDTSRAKPSQGRRCL